MRQFFIVSVLFLGVLINARSQSVGLLHSIDSLASSVSFKVSNFMVSTVEGGIKGMKGSVKFNPDSLSLSSFSVCINAATINTGNSERDEHLKSEDFFEVSKYPLICFESTQIVRTKTGFKTTGILSMHGVSRVINILFTVDDDKLTGDFSLDRLEYNIGEKVGGITVGKQVDIKLICVLI